MSNEEHSPLETPNSNENASPEPQSSGKKGLIIGIIILIAFLAGGYFMMSSNNNEPAVEETISLAQAQHQSDSLYNELKKQLAAYKQENEELYSQIARKEAELESQYSKIKRLIDQAKRDKDARKEIEMKLQNLATELGSMKKYVEDQTLDLNELREENRRLRKEKEALDEQYLAELEERARLEQEGHDLQAANEELNEKLKTASVLQTKNVMAKGLKVKNNGDRKGINNAKRTELIEVCFDIVTNEVCESGPNRFFLRMIDPSGAVVFDANRGSGKMTLFDNGEEIGYTTSKIFNYSTSIKNLCLEWFAYPTTPFRAGTYRIEIYNKGRRVGSYDFTTK